MRGSARLSIVAVLLAVTFASPTYSATVTPTDAVKRHVVVRAAPSAQSAQLDKLNPGDQADVLDSVPHWFKVQLSNGVVGFVNKGWVTEAAPSPAPTVGGGGPTPTTTPVASSGAALAPLIAASQPPVSWWFVFKFNAVAFPNCGGPTQQCPFGGEVKTNVSFSQQFAYATSASPTLQQGTGCVGDTDADPVGATFGELYNGTFHYVVWNDQFYGDPQLGGCPPPPTPPFCKAPWAHSKGMIAWNDAGDGLIMQVTTPSWPAAGSATSPRQSDGNTLGCIQGDNNIKYSQDFFALQLTHDDLLKVLAALQNASVPTDPANPQIVSNGGPADVQTAVSALGTQSASHVATTATLSTGVQLISKPSALRVPPWQMVSALLGGVPLRTATWWSSSKIPTTTATTVVGCWDSSLGAPGGVEVATSGQWQGQSLNLKGGGSDGNHAKIGVSTAGTHHYAIFGDMNQEGALSGNSTQCAAHQNGRGGLFFVIDDATLSSSISGLIQGSTAPQ